MVSRVNTYEDQYVCSLAERLFMLMDQQFRMLPGLFDPARDAFYHRQGIEDVMTPGADTAIAHNVEMVMDNGRSPPPPGKYWPVFVDVPGNKCKAVRPRSLQSTRACGRTSSKRSSGRTSCRQGHRI